MYKAFYYIYTVAKNSAGQKKKVLFQMINHAIFLLFCFYLYKYVYELVPNLENKLPFANTIWSMSIYFVIFWLSLQRLERSFRDDILSGNVEMYLLRPMPYVLQKVFIQIGEGLLSFSSAAVLSVGISYLFVGLPQINAPYLIWFFCILILLLLSQVLSCLLYSLCGLSGFWIENSQPVYFVVTKLIMIFGGAWVPVAFFPEVLQNFAKFSPFGGVLATSFSMYPDFLSRFPVLFFNVLFWVVILAVLTYLVSKRSVKKLAVNG